MRARCCLFSLAAALAVTAAPSRGHAQSASLEAQSLFDEGRRLLAAGKVAEACAAFESSEKLDPVVTTLLNLAQCRETNHQLATAWGLFVDAARMARDGNAKAQKFERTAQSHARKLEPRLSKLAINVAPDRQLAGLEITRNGEPIHPASWNHALPIDGGSYTIAVRAPGHVEWTVTRTIKLEGDAQVVDVPRLADAPLPVATREPAPAPIDTATPVAAPPAAPRAQASYVPAIVVGAGALALGGGALGLSFAGDAKYDKAKSATTQALQQSLVDQANTRRYLAQGVGIAAAVAAGTAVYLYLHTRSERRSETLAVAPIAGPQLGGLAVVGNW